MMEPSLARRVQADLAAFGVQKGGGETMLADTNFWHQDLPTGVFHPVMDHAQIVAVIEPDEGANRTGHITLTLYEAYGNSACTSGNHGYEIVGILNQ